MKQGYSTDSGFSLIELLATIVIGLILAMVIDGSPSENVDENKNTFRPCANSSKYGKSDEPIKLAKSTVFPEPEGLTMSSLNGGSNKFG
jgi:prepilin-type N-terminal cleavage/methylation domain-containing protein